MDQQKLDSEEQEPVKPAGKFIRIKPFALIMIVFLTILLTAGLTIFALTFGEKKVVEVKVPVERTEFSELYNAFDELKEKYYKEFDDEELVYGAINGMFDALGDPYTDYMNKDEASSFNDSLSSSFQGIGAEIQERNGFIMVVSPIKNSPAEKAGLQPRDLILSVDGTSIKGMSSSEAVLLIRGEKGSEVTLEIERGENTEPMIVKITRDDIPIETVYGELDEDKIAHVQITSFSEDTATEVKTILADFEEQGMVGIILDVRQNPGGFLNAAIEISNLFVEEGKAILQVEDRLSEPQIIYAEGGKKYKLPITVLIDEGSASASEILAGALGESAGAELIGLTSFGKGTVQEVSYLDGGANLKFTTGKWLTPKGNWINEKGIKPTIKVAYPEYASLPYIDPSVELTTDSQSGIVEAAELMLDVLGYDPGDVDETYTEQTASAVEKFQAANELEVTGILVEETTYALMDALRVKMLEDDPQMLKAKEVLLKKLTN